MTFRQNSLSLVVVFVVVLIGWKQPLQDDNYIHRSSGECQPVCILPVTGALERQHLQASIQGDADILRPICDAESDLSPCTH